MLYVIFKIQTFSEPKPHRDASEQSHKQRAQKIHEHEDDPRRLVEADIYLQVNIAFVVKTKVYSLGRN